MKALLFLPYLLKKFKIEILTTIGTFIVFLMAMYMLSPWACLLFLLLLFLFGTLQPVVLVLAALLTVFLIFQWRKYIEDTTITTLTNPMDAMKQDEIYKGGKPLEFGNFTPRKNN